MFFSRTAVALAAAGLVSAVPVVEKRDTAITDGDILNYALTLEHLEDKFYREGLANFTEDQFASAGFDSTFYANLKEVSSDETTHVSFLTKALTGKYCLPTDDQGPNVLLTMQPAPAAGVTPVDECVYSFGVTDVATFVATASILEGVGVSAYLGAAADIMSKSYLTDAGSILTVEARHSAYLRSTLKQVPFAQPFDTPLTIDEVYSLASQFIVSCPATNPALPVKAFPVLTLSSNSTTPVVTGATITLLTPVS
jgi:hypothetical protein